MRRAGWGLVALFGACDAAAPTRSPTPASAPVVTPPAPAVAVPLDAPPEPAKPPEPPEPPLAGVGPGGAEGRAARRQATLALLTDGRGAAGLEQIDSPPGVAFDPDLADAMTPTRWIDGPAVAAVLQKPATVKGKLDRDLIRRIVRAHINEVRYCYNQGLSRDPNLGGKIVIDFQILGDGKVGTSVVASSTVHDEDVPPCVAAAVLRWRFPSAEDHSTVEVSYPFVLAPAGTSTRGL